MKTFYIIALSIITTSVFSQGITQKLADKYYSQLAYAEASEYYKDLCKSKTPLEANVRKAAECYFNLLDYTNAITYYNMLEQKFSASVTSLDLLNMIQCYKYLGKYEKVDAVLAKLSLKQANSSVVKNHKNNPKYITEIKKDSSNYKITNVEGINTENSEFSPVVFEKKKYMMYASNRRNTSAVNKVYAWDNSYFMNMYTSLKVDSSNFKTGVEMAKAVETKYHDGPVELSTDENTMYLTRTNYIGKKVGLDDKRIVNLKLYILKRDTTGKLSEPESFPYNSDAYSVGHAAITKDGSRLYFVSDMPGGFGQTDIWYSEWKDNKWQKPINLGQSINTEGREMFPHVNEDGYLFFSSDGRAGLGGLDIFWASPELDEYFEASSISYPLNTQYDDFGFYIAEDLKTGYVSSNRPGGKGKDDIYYWRSKEPLIGVTISGKITDDNTKQILPGALVILLDKNNKIIDSVRADANGMYTMRIPDPSKKYSLGVKERSRYYDKLLSLNDLVPGENTQNVALSPKYRVNGIVVDTKTNEPLTGVKVTLIPKYKGDTKKYETNSKGTYTDLIKNKKVGDKLEWAIKYEKEGYLTIIEEFSIKLDTNTYVNINGKMQKLEKDVVLDLNLNPIYFDLAKWNIRPDGAIELNKVVDVMKQNPKMVIELGSHTDCRSTASSNMKLSDKRAKSSADYIISQGIEKFRIYGKGYGESKLINKCECEGAKVVPCTEEEHQQNRRTEFKVVSF